MSKSESKSKSKITFRRQGDVGIIHIGKEIADPGKPVPRDKGRVVLAYGEVTGHAHAIDHRRAKLHEMPESFRAKGLDSYPAAWQRVLYAPVPVILRHEEHREIKLPAGDYVIRRQREYSPEELRAVAD